MSTGKFDEFIKKQLSNSSPDVPSRVWENIMAAREGSKPKLIWWGIAAKNVLMSLAILLGCSSVTWILMHHGYDPNKNALAVVSATVKNNSTTTNSNTVEKQNVLQSSSVAANTVQAGQALSTNNNSAFVNNNNTSNNIFNSHRSSIKRNNRNHFNAQLNNTADDENENSVATTDDRETASTNTEESMNNASASLLDPYTDKISPLSVLSRTDNILKPNKAAHFSLPECPTVEKGPIRSRDYVEFYAGPDYGIRSMSDNENPQYLKARDSSSHFTSGYSVGARYTKVFNNGFSLRAGLNYSQINEWFTPAKNNILSVTYTVDPVTHDTTAKTFTYKLSRNHYSSIDIPITAGYEVAIGEDSRFVVNVNAGPIINVYSWQNGDVLDTANNTVHISTSSAPYSPYVFKTVIGVGVVGNISLYYKLTDNLAILAEPYFRYNFKQMTQDVQPFNEKYSTIGLHLGVRIDLH